MDIIAILSELIPDFGPLLAFISQDSKTDVSSLDPFTSTLRTVSRDPLVLSRAMLDYISLVRDAKAMGNYNTLVKECSLLNRKHRDVVVAMRAINVLRTTGRVEGTIHSLPMEIMSHIFVLSTISPYEEPGDLIGDPFNMQFRAVCRHWRDVIDKTPALWTCVYLEKRVNDVDRLRAVLKRSKQIPLKLSVEVKIMDDQLLSTLLPQMERTRRLWVDDDDFAAPIAGTTDEERNSNLARARVLTQTLMGSPAPLLESFHVSSLRIPNNLFSHMATPHLHKIYLDECGDVLSTACIFKSVDLTSLILKDTKVWDSVNDMLTLLHTLPKLRHFSFDAPLLFEDTLPFHSPQDFGSNSVRLLHLEHLEMAIPIETVAELVNILDFPAFTKLVIRASFRDDPDIDSPEFALLLHNLRVGFQPHFQKLFPNNTPGYESMRIGWHERYEADDGFSMKMKSSDRPSDSGPPDFEFGVIWGSEYHAEYMDILIEALRWPGMARDVASIEVEQKKFLNRESQWDRLLAYLPALADVNVYGPNVLPFISVLQSSSLPIELETLSIHRVKAETLALVSEVLDRRAQAGNPKLNLSLSSCDVDLAMISRLKLHEGVRQFNWDGRETREWFYSSDDDEEMEEVALLEGNGALSGEE